VRVLLDTHILLWWLDDDRRLAPHLRTAIGDGANEILVSAVSVAEIEIKKALGKVNVPRELLTLLDEAGFVTLPLAAAHAQQLRELPPHHGDPFDRMLVAQAMVERLPLATADARLGSYGVEILAN
jgi:PIN domain nuclease of toxin-antitoxin system